MQKRIRSARQIIAELIAFIDSDLARTGASQEALAAAAGVDQATVSRLLKRRNIEQLKGPIRLGPGVRKLCNYADISVTETVQESQEGREMLNTAITAVWDGSLIQAKRLARAIKTLRGLGAN